VVHDNISSVGLMYFL